MNIPDGNPLFNWVLNQRYDRPISYVTLSVDGIQARMALTHTVEIHNSSHETYLTTQWALFQ